MLDFIYIYYTQWQYLDGILGWFGCHVPIFRAKGTVALNQPTHDQSAHYGKRIHPNPGTKDIIGNHFVLQIIQTVQVHVFGQQLNDLIKVSV